MIRLRRKFEADVAVERVVAQIDEVSALAGWLPGVTGAEVLAREGDISVIELQGPRLHGGRLVLERVRTSAHAWVFAEADRYRGHGITGSLNTKPSATGAAVDLTIQWDAVFFDLVARRRLRREVDRALAALLRRAAESGESAEAPDRRKIFEIIRRDGELFVNVNGRVFELPVQGCAS